MVSRPAIESVLAVLAAAPGGPGGWLAAHGITAAALTQLRQRLVGPAEA
jgi:hypothetical protein